MQDWYLMTSPNVTSGYEDDAISEFAQSNFTDVLATSFSDSVTLYNSDLTLISTTKAVVQGNTSNNENATKIREILFPIGTCKTGMLVLYDNAYWMITGYPGNNKSYEKAVMKICNYLLKWQDAFGNIIERWCITESDESLGVDGNRTVPLGDGKMNIIIPYDSETIKIRKDKRFYIDNNLADPIPYKVTNASTTSNVRNGHGYLTFVVSEGQTIPEKDRPDLMLCDYISPTVTPTPAPDERLISSTITGITTLKIGYAKTYTVAFTDASGNALTDVNFTWNVVSDFDSAITKTISGQSITLKVSDDTYVGKTIALQVVIDGTVNSSVVITVKPLL